VAPRKDANEALLLAAISHRVGLERVSTTTVKRVLSLIRRVEQDVLQRIAVTSALNRDTGRLEAFLSELRSLYADGYSRLKASIEGDLYEIAAYEAQWQARTIGAVVGVATNVPTLNALVAATNSRPFQGKLLRGWLDDLPQGAAQRVQEAIRIGFAEGEPTDAIVRRVRGTKTAKYKDGVMEISRRGAESMVRTAVSHMASTAQELTYEVNDDILEGVEWVSVLDSRTTEICRARDGKLYPIGKGPRPPAHIRCRSTTISRVKGVEPPPRLTYGEWLKRQSAATQDEILGKARGKLFREGGLAIDRFVDPAGRSLTLAQLKAREARAFELAGLE